MTGVMGVISRVERMSPADSAFWHMESDASRMHNVTLAVFDGPAPDPADLIERVAHRVPLVPRFRQRILPVPMQLERPAWADDPDFEVESHVTVTSWPDGDLERLVSRIVSETLNRGRPLWHLHLITDLPDNRWALISKVHHCLIDGVSGTDLLAVLVDDIVADAVPRVWRPGPLPSDGELLMQALTQLTYDPAEQYRAVRAGLGRRRRQWNRLVGRLADSTGATSSSLSGPVGHQRTWASVSFPLEKLAKARGKLGVSTHEVVLGLVASGLRQLVVVADGSGAADTEPPADLKAMVPVAMSDQSRRSAGGIAAEIVDLPTGERDPSKQIRRIGAGKKSHSAAIAAGALSQLPGLAAPAIATLGLREATRQGRTAGDIAAVVVNVPGPRATLRMLDRPLVEIYPVLPLAPRVRVSVGVFSYANNMSIGVTTDRSALPDPTLVTEGITEALAKLQR